MTFRLRELVLVALFPLIGLAGLPADYAGKPFNQSPIGIPGTVKAVEYDVAPGNANGISFNYNSGPKAGSIRKTDDCIGLGKFDPSHVTINGDKEDTSQTYLGWTHVGEWTRYTLHVKEAGNYTISAHVAAGLKGAKLNFTFGDITTGPIEIPTTAGHQSGVEVYHVWERLDKLATVKLPAGDVVMTMKIEEQAGLNIESITIKKVD